MTIYSVHIVNEKEDVLSDMRSLLSRNEQETTLKNSAFLDNFSIDTLLGPPQVV
jgi:hypothetical protein